MPSWRTTLTAAGVSGSRLRDDYTYAARRVLRREPAPYLALRMLAAPPLVPFLAAGLAFMNLVDDVAETGTPQQRAAGLAALSERVEAALKSGDSPDPLLRAYAHAVASRGLSPHWVSRFLAGAATAEAGFDGFEAEEDFQAYLDAYAWPGCWSSPGSSTGAAPTPNRRRAGGASSTPPSAWTSSPTSAGTSRTAGSASPAHVSPNTR